MRTRVIYGVAAAGVAALAGFFAWKYWPRPPVPPPHDPPGAVFQVNTMDELLKELAKRVATQSGEAKDFQVLVTVYQDPIGTLMEPGRSVADDDESCRPKAEPEKRDAPSLFPAFKTNGTVAGDFGLEAPLSELGKAGVTTRAADSVIVTIDAPGRLALTGAKLRAILDDPICRKALGSRTMWLVRGYISGQREFTVSSDRSVQLKGAMKVASFDVHPAGANLISMKDDKERLFLQIVSEVQAPALTESANMPSMLPSILPKATPGPTATPSLAAPQLTAPKAPAAAAAATGRIYIQQDQADAPAHAQALINALSAYNVVRKVELIPSAKMPLAPQVRYFNEADKSRAEEVAGVLKKGAGLDAGVKRIALPAPSGQLEVWLQRVGAAPADIGKDRVAVLRPEAATPAVLAGRDRVVAARPDAAARAAELGAVRKLP